MGEHRKILADRKILLVEDDYLMADALAEALRNTGAVVFGPIGTVEDALHSVSRLDGIEAVVLDVNLVGQRAYAVADAVREKQIPLVFVTGCGRDLLPSRFAEVPHCLKPVDIEQLACLLDAQIEA